MELHGCSNHTRRLLSAVRPGGLAVPSSATPRRPRIQRRSVVLAVVALALSLATMSTGVILSRSTSKSQIVANLKARGMSSAGFLSAFITQQAKRESEDGQRFLASPQPSSSELRLLTSSLGSQAAVLLDRSGRLLDVVPSDRALIGSDIAARYAHLATAETGHSAVSGVVGSAAAGEVWGGDRHYRLAGSSPHTRAATLARANGALAHALRHASSGAV